MKPIPDSVHHHLANARLYADAATKFLLPTNNAPHISLLLTAWENVAIAEAELNAWAREEDVDEKIYKDHAHKFKDAPIITRVILGPSGTKAREITFSSGRDFSELRLACQYGSNTESKNVADIFAKGWFTDDFQNSLANKIKWIDTMINIYEREVRGAKN